MRMSAAAWVGASIGSAGTDVAVELLLAVGRLHFEHLWQLDLLTLPLSLLGALIGGASAEILFRR